MNAAKATITGNRARWVSLCSACGLRIHLPYDPPLHEVKLDNGRYAYLCSECKEQLKRELQEPPHEPTA